jgi:hypothetical protein
MHRDVLHVEVRGSGSYANTVAYWRAIVEQVRERQPVSMVLVDETVGPPLTGDEWFSLVQSMAGAGLENVRIAHVKPHGLERIEYCEIYAREAGIAARVFVSEEEAERWLRYSEYNRHAG